MRKVQIIIASTRPQRIGRQIAEWVQGTIPPSAGFAAELVDLVEWHLPLSDEPGVPASGNYVQEHTKAWSRKIASADGFVFVTPQYNWGYPASLKNALDHLFKEWNAKPAAIVSYGHHGGGKAAAQLRQVLDGLRMRPAATMPAIVVTKEMLAADARLRDPSADFAPFAEDVRRAAAELAALHGDRDQAEAAAG